LLTKGTVLDARGIHLEHLDVLFHHAKLHVQAPDAEPPARRLVSRRIDIDLGAVEEELVDVSPARRGRSWGE